MRMRIAVDEQIPGAGDLFGELGDVRLFAGRTVTPSDVADADALVVRSVTQVGAQLLENSRVRFVGTTTSGTDHVDTTYLASRSIAFADAAGSNARPVAEYVLTAILLLADRHGFDPRDTTLGVVGVGRIGLIVAAWAESLGMTVLRCDPPLAEARGVVSGLRSADRPWPSIHWSTPAQLLAASDIITLHVPLTFDGPHKTAEMVNAAWLGAMRPGAFLINTSRGAVVSEPALRDARVAGRLGGVVLDVWLNEPRIDASLVARCEIATPHIAGQSIEAKRRAARMIRQALDAWLRRQADTTIDPTGSADDGPASARLCSADPPRTTTTQDGGAGGPRPTPRDALTAMLKACDIAGPGSQLRNAAKRGAVATAFDTIRSQCGTRREFAASKVDLSSFDPATAGFLRTLGFPD